MSPNLPLHHVTIFYDIVFTFYLVGTPYIPLFLRSWSCFYENMRMSALKITLSQLKFITLLVTLRALFAEMLSRILE